MTQQVQPIFILPEDTKRTQGKDAQRNNIMAAKAVAETVRTTLGPKGMDKMLVDSMGDVVVTNDGVTILKEMQVSHPAAKMVVEVAKTQEDVVGDGTTTAVVLAGELLKKAEELLDLNIHPTVLVKGYQLAEKEAQRLLGELGVVVTLEDKDKLQQIVVTAMTGKGAAAKGLLSELLVKGVGAVAEEQEGKMVVPKGAIKIEKQIGTSAESMLVEGIVIDRERVHPGMPLLVRETKVALLNVPLEIRNTEIDAKIQITDPNQLQAFLVQEERSLREIVEKIVASGATAVFCQKGIDDLAQHFLAKAGILAARRVKKSDMERLARATGGKIVNSWKELSPHDLGFAGEVKEVLVGDEEMIFVEKCKNPKAVTILVKGSTSHVAEEVKRAVEDALGDVSSAIKDGRVVAGAGAIEMELALGLRQYARGLQGKEQLAVQAFADAIEIIPRTLAENAGLDPIDILTQLRARNEGIEKKRWSGINVFDGGIMDAWNEGVIEPLQIKAQALRSAADVAEMILRIDDVILASKGEQMTGIPQG